MDTLPPPLPKGRTLPINGEVVRTLRLQRQLDIEELARKAGYNSRTIDNIESRGVKPVYAATLMAIAKALGVSHADLLAEPIGEHSPPQGRRVSGSIHFRMKFENLDASDELIALMNRLAQAIGARSEIEVLAVEDGSLVVTVGMSEEDALRLIAAFGDVVSHAGGGEGRLDALAVEEISLPPSHMRRQVAGLIEKATPDDYKATRPEESNLYKLGFERGWYLLKIAQYEEESTGLGNRARDANTVLEELTAEATRKGMAPEPEAVFAARLLFRTLKRTSPILYPPRLDGSGGLRIIRRPPERPKAGDAVPTPPAPEEGKGDAG